MFIEVFYKHTFLSSAAELDVITQVVVSAPRRIILLPAEHRLRLSDLASHAAVMHHTHVLSPLQYVCVFSVFLHAPCACCLWRCGESHLHCFLGKLTKSVLNVVTRVQRHTSTPTTTNYKRFCGKTLRVCSLWRKKLSLSYKNRNCISSSCGLL